MSQYCNGGALVFKHFTTKLLNHLEPQFNQEHRSTGKMESSNLTGKQHLVVADYKMPRNKLNKKAKAKARARVYTKTYTTEQSENDQITTSSKKKASVKKEPKKYVACRKIISLLNTDSNNLQRRCSISNRRYPCHQAEWDFRTVRTFATRVA
jgi:hypothetical protein